MTWLNQVFGLYPSLIQKTPQEGHIRSAGVRWIWESGRFTGPGGLTGPGESTGEIIVYVLKRIVLLH